MKSNVQRAIVLIASSILLNVHCGGDDDGSTGDQPATFFDLSIKLDGYGMTHNGDKIYFNLVEDGSTVSIAKSNIIIESGGGGGGGSGGGAGGGNDNSPNFDKSIKSGASYKLYFFDDANKNGTCETTDHSWVLDIPTVSANVELTHRHGDNYLMDCTNQSP